MPMPFINAQVSSEMLAKVSRMFNGTAGDIVTELLQNARRAGATRVHLITSNEVRQGATVALLRVDDDGCGIADPSALLDLGHSGWGKTVADREDPAGMGVFSLAGRHVRISSRAAVNDLSWSATIEPSHWTSGAEIAVDACARRPGTSITIEVPYAWLADLSRVVARAARYYPLPVMLDNERQYRQAFLDGALHVEQVDGTVIGVFHAAERCGTFNPALNFHGLTVDHPLPVITEVGVFESWFARVDIVDCPALQLTLPARKEVVSCDFLARLDDAVRAAIFRAIAGRTGHRLSFAAWREARSLGVDLPAASAGLEPFIPTTLDTSLAVPGNRPAVHGDDLVVAGHYDAAHEQTLGRALAVSGSPLHGRLVRAEPRFAGYDWYDQLAAVETLRFVIQQGESIHIVGEDIEDGLTIDDPHVDAVAVELTVRERGVSRVHQLDSDLLVLPDDNHDLDEAPIAVVTAFAASRTSPLTPASLATYLDAAYFCASDDRECDSVDTQLRAWQECTIRLATTLLDGKDAANVQAIEAAFRRYIAWMVPQGHTLRLNFHGDGFATLLTLTPPGCTPPPIAPPVAR